MLTKRHLEMLAKIDQGMAAADGQAVDLVTELISSGLLTGIRLGYANLALTPTGRQALARAQAATETGETRDMQEYNRRHTDRPRY